MAESVVLETSMGEIQLELYWNHAPKVGQPQPHAPAIDTLTLSHPDLPELR